MMNDTELTQQGNKLGAIIEILERGLTEKTLRYWDAGLPLDGLVDLAVEEAGEPEQCLEDKVQAYAESQLNILCAEKVEKQCKEHQEAERIWRESTTPEERRAQLLNN
jgi:hypothetical protein